MNAVEDIRRDLHGAVEAERHISAPDVVVDGLRQGDDIEAFLAQKICGFLCAVATEDDEAVELHLLVVILHVLDFIDAVFIDDAHELERLAGGAQNGTAER